MSYDDSEHELDDHNEEDDGNDDDDDIENYHTTSTSRPRQISSHRQHPAYHVPSKRHPPPAESKLRLLNDGEVIDFAAMANAQIKVQDQCTRLMETLEQARSLVESLTTENVELRKFRNSIMGSIFGNMGNAGMFDGLPPTENRGPIAQLFRLFS
jgi:hypothetical protein